MRTYTVSVYDPRRRTTVLVVHEGFSRADADELIRIYAAIGYPRESVARSGNVLKYPRPLVGSGYGPTCLSTGPAGVNNRDKRGYPRNASTRHTCDIGASDTGS
jgi:hypothetical protein